MSPMDQIIQKLYKERWSGSLADAPIEEQRKQLQETLQKALDGYWSGHTAYFIAVDGGFLLDIKPNKLTYLGKMFMKQMDKGEL